MARCQAFSRGREFALRLRRFGKKKKKKRRKNSLNDRVTKTPRTLRIG